MRVKFCGAAQAVTGSAHLITLSDGTTVLLDCGLYQGRSESLEDFNKKWLFDPKKIDVVILSHAHIDHSGRLPKLVKDGYEGQIYTTHATRSLCSIMLMDSAHIQERDAFYYNKKNPGKKKEPLYRSVDVEKTVNMFVGVGYDHWQRVLPGVEVLFRDAGHILGSASITLRIEEGGEKRVIGFTGDIGRPDRPILKDPKPMDEVEYLIMESTYGDKLHTAAPDEADRLLEVIRETCIENKGKLLIPAFSIGRTQEIVYMLDQMQNKGVLPKVPVYVDSPLAIDATEIFTLHPECFDQDLHRYMISDPNPFGFRDLKYTRKVEHSKHLNTSKEPCVIISASGMMNAGRVKHHLFHVMQNPRNTILIVGYCAPYTPGGQLRAGETTLKLFNEEVDLKANIEIMESFSAHADQQEMYEFVKNQRGNLKRLFLVHGTLERQETFKEFLKEKGFQKVDIPALGQEFNMK